MLLELGEQTQTVVSKAGCGFLNLVILFGYSHRGKRRRSLVNKMMILQEREKETQNKGIIYGRDVNRYISKN